VNSRSYDGTEPSTLHDNTCVRTPANSHNFVTNVFPLSITVSPNHQSLCASGLLLQVFLDVFFVSRNGNFNWCFKKTEGIATVPGLVRGTEVLIHKMSDDRSNGILGPGLRVIEIIVLDVWGGSVALPKLESTRDAVGERVILTVEYWPPERICATDLAMDGFSATHRTRMCYTNLQWVSQKV
jgi:hypothetical protein